MRQPIAAALLAGTLLLVACGDDTTTPAAGAGEPASDPKACAAGKTVTKDTLTIATGEPAFPPYVINDATPQDGQGFEAAVAMAVAKELGFEGDKVKWARTAFDAAIAPGPKDFDFNLQQYTITDERKKVVDFSDGYYTAAQAIFGLADSPAANAKTLADLQGLKIGVASGTTSVTYVEETIKPKAEPLILPDNAAAKTALESNQIDAIVSDLPTALFITAVEIEGHQGLRPDRRQRHRPVRSASGQGQPADGVCQRRVGQHDQERRARHHHHEMDGRVHRGAGHQDRRMTLARRAQR
jgi:polar amino acid transport system substrate-binding protein